MKHLLCLKQETEKRWQAWDLKNKNSEKLAELPFMLYAQHLRLIFFQMYGLELCFQLDKVHGTPDSKISKKTYILQQISFLGWKGWGL